MRHIPGKTLAHARQEALGLNDGFNAERANEGNRSMGSGISAFETPEQEIRKFTERLRRLGVNEWPREAKVVELSAGAATDCTLWNAWVSGISKRGLVPTIAGGIHGRSALHRGRLPRPALCESEQRCRHCQGGLHHLPLLPDDLERVFAELKRVLRPSGHVVFVEPWLTPFLHFVHVVSGNLLARRLSTKLDALATMIENERQTYENWLGRPQEISQLANRYFQPEHESFTWGKWNFVGRRTRKGIAAESTSHNRGNLPGGRGGWSAESQLRKHRVR